MIEEMFLLQIIEFFLKFWFISLFIRWIISFLPGKISDMIRFAGNLFRYPVKRFFYWLYGVTVLETDLEKSVFKTEEVNDFDCRFTSNIAGPLLILSYIASFFLYWADFFYVNFMWIGIVFYILAFSIALMTAPDFRESEEILRVSVSSIFKWLGKVIFLCLPAYLLLHYFIVIEALAQGVFILLLLIPIYHHRRAETQEISVKTKKAKVLEVDPFGE